jgi:cell division septum initiation protein DivIVA
MEIKRPFTIAQWLETPEAVRQYIELLEKSISQLSDSITDLKVRIEKLEQQVNRNSQNSNQLPSADGTFKNRNVKAKRANKSAAVRRVTPEGRQAPLAMGDGQIGCGTLSGSSKPVP